LLLDAPVCHCQVKFGLSLSLPPAKASSQAPFGRQFAGSSLRYVTVVFFGTPLSDKRPPTPLTLVVSNQSVLLGLPEHGEGLGLALARRLPSISNPPGSPLHAVPAPTTSVNCVQAVTVPWVAVSGNARPTSSGWITKSELEMFPYPSAVTITSHRSTLLLSVIFSATSWFAVQPVPLITTVSPGM